MKKILILVLIPLALSNCASILNSKYQKVEIDTDRDNTILVNGETPEKKDGQYLLKRDRTPKQITVKHDGYKDEHVTVMQYKRSPLYILSWVPFGVLFLPPFYDNGDKAYDYEKIIEVGDNLVKIPTKSEDSKNVKLNKISIDLNQEDIQYRDFYSYKRFLRREDNVEPVTDHDIDEIKLDNTIFTALLNEMLKEQGFIDTTKRVLKNSYLNNIYLNASIRNYTIHNINNHTVYTHGYGLSYSPGMVYVDLVIEWEALDYYKNTVFEHKSQYTSGQFALYDYDNMYDRLGEAMKDAIEYGLIDFMQNEKMVALLHDNTEIDNEAAFETIEVPRADSYVSNLSEAIQASVTILTKEGHGSGFVISNNGHIITNYHVVSNTEDLKVIMNDGTEYDVDIVRVSKIYDLALLKVDAENLKSFHISNSKNIEIAKDIYAVGTPNAQDLSQSVSKGIISGIRNTETRTQMIQTDASINSGNSGGALVNDNGHVLGVVNSKLLGLGVEGVAFGIPSYEIFDKLNVEIK